MSSRFKRSLSGLLAVVTAASMSQLAPLYTAAEELAELFRVFLGEQFADHAEHALYAFAECGKLFVCFENGEFGSLHDASRDEVESEVFLFARVLRLDDPADEPLNLWYEPDE